MISVALTSAHDLRFMLRQTPRGDGVWGDMRVTLDGSAEPHGPVEWLVVVDAPPPGLITTVPPSRRILVVTEPPAVRQYPASWLRRFGAVVAARRPNGFRGPVLAGHACLPWFYGVAFGNAGPVARLDWNALTEGPRGPRDGAVSAICSTKRLTLQQVRRLRLLDHLSSALGDQLSVFGRGFAPLRDKAEGLDGFRYHLVLENNAQPGLWTEKLADPILAGAFPIVAKGSGLARWFDPLGFAEIDLRKPRAAVAAVRRLLGADPARLPGVQAALAANRRALMERYQLFPVLAAHVAGGAARDPLEAPAPMPPPGRPIGQRLYRPFRSPALAIARYTLPIIERG